MNCVYLVKSGLIRLSKRVDKPRVQTAVRRDFYSSAGSTAGGGKSNSGKKSTSGSAISDLTTSFVDGSMRNQDSSTHEEGNVFFYYRKVLSSEY